MIYLFIYRIQMWVTKGIIKSINTKDKMYKNWSNIDVTVTYMRHSKHISTSTKTLKKKIAKAKRIYHVEVFSRFKNNIKQTWKVIKKLCTKTTLLKHPKDFVIMEKL